MRLYEKTITVDLDADGMSDEQLESLVVVIDSAIERTIETLSAKLTDCKFKF